MVPINGINIRFCTKKITQHFNGSSSVSSEKLQGREVLAMKNISLEYLHYVMFSKNIF